MPQFLIADEESLKENLKQRSDFRLTASDCLLRFSEEIAQNLTLAQTQDLPPKVLKRTLRLQEALHKKIEHIHKTESKDRRKVREDAKKLEKMQSKCNFSERDMGHLKTIETPSVKTFLKKKEHEQLQEEYRRFEAEVQERLLKKQKKKIKQKQQQLEDEQKQQHGELLKEERKRKEEEEKQRREEFKRLQEQQRISQKIEEESPWYSSPEPEEKSEPSPLSPQIIDAPPELPEEIDMPQLESREPTPEIEPEPMIPSPSPKSEPEQPSKFPTPPIVEPEITEKIEEIKPINQLKPIKAKKLKTPGFRQPASFTCPNKNNGVFGDVWTKAAQKKKKLKNSFSSSLLGRQQRELKRLERETQVNLKKFNGEGRYVSTKKLKNKENRK